jgi:protein phosphatase
MAHRSHRPIDETMIDATRPAGPGSVGQQVGPTAIQVSIATDIGRVRRNNEDYVQAERFVRDGRRYSMWAVADGVGGGPQGELASKTAVETVVDYLAHEPWTDPTVALTEAFALANRNVYEITGEGAAASTLVVALVSDPEGMVCIANVGDSRAYIVTGAEARQITDDHSIVAARVAAGQITAAEARTAPDRNVLTRSIGSETETLVDIFGPRQLQPYERLILCSDGVHGMIDDGAIGRLVGGLPIAESAGAVVAAAVEAGGKDNATALVGGYAQAPAFAAAAPLATGVAAGAARAGSGHGIALPILAAGAIAVVLILIGILALVVFAASPPSTPAATQSATALPTATPSAVPTPTPSATLSSSPSRAAVASANARKNVTDAPPPAPARVSIAPSTAPSSAAPSTPTKPEITCDVPTVSVVSGTVHCTLTGKQWGTVTWMLSGPYGTNAKAPPYDTTTWAALASSATGGAGIYTVWVEETDGGLMAKSNIVTITVTPGS